MIRSKGPPHFGCAFIALGLFLCLVSLGHTADREVTLQWDRSIDDPYLDWYQVYYSRTPGGHTAPLTEGQALRYRRQTGLEFSIAGAGGNTPIRIPKEETQITLIFSPENSNDYYFVVTAVDKRGLEGVPTPEISIIRMRFSKEGAGTGTVTDDRPSLGIRSEIDCGPVCTSDWADYVGGSSVTLSETADSGTAFMGWTGSCVGADDHCTLTVGPGAAVTAKFLPILSVVKAGAGKGTVTAVPDGVGSSDIYCGTACTSDSAVYADTAAVTVNAVADAGNIFTGWSGACSGEVPCIVTMDAPKTVWAYFKPLHRLSLTKTGTGRGTVTESPPLKGVNSDINCGTGCSFDTADYREGDEVTLVASPNPGNTFTGWSGGCSGTGLTCTVTMDAAKSVTANFIPYLRLSVTKDGAGEGTISRSLPGISCGTACSPDSADYSFNTDVTLTATPNEGNNFAGWTGCDSVNLALGTCTVKIDAATTVTANFVKKGDVNLDGAANLADAILIFQVLSRKLHDSVYHVTDADSDGKLGLADAIYLLQKGAGLR